MGGPGPGVFEYRSVPARAGSRLSRFIAAPTRAACATTMSGWCCRLVRQHGSLAKDGYRPDDRTFGADASRSSCASLKRRAAVARGAAARQDRPAIDPDVAQSGRRIFLGLKIGRRSAELVLIDFLGRIRAMLQMPYRYPAPEPICQLRCHGHDADDAQALTPKQDERIAGLGIAMPFELWNWADTVGAPQRSHGRMARPRHPRRIAAQCSLPGLSAERRDFGLRRRTGVRPDQGRHAISSISTSAPSPAAASCSTAGFMAGRPAMPARWARCRCRDRTAQPRQLIDIASIAMLERAVTELGRDASPLWTSPEDWGEIGAELDHWIERAGKALA